MDVFNGNRSGEFADFLPSKGAASYGKDFEVQLSFGMHVGWAIEGAIGSKFKIDASYLSPNVNIAARLASSTSQFQTQMLLSEDIYNMASAGAREKLRVIDKVTLKGSQKPLKLVVFDIHNWPDRNQHFLEPRFDEYGRQEPISFASNAEIAALRLGMSGEFFTEFDASVSHYIMGKWEIAKNHLQKALSYFPDDGPGLALYDVMKRHHFQAPADWKGYRKLTEK